MNEWVEKNKKKIQDRNSFMIASILFTLSFSACPCSHFDESVYPDEQNKLGPVLDTVRWHALTENLINWQKNGIQDYYNVLLLQDFKSVSQNFTYEFFISVIQTWVLTQ